MAQIRALRLVATCPGAALAGVSGPASSRSDTAQSSLGSKQTLPSQIDRLNWNCSVNLPCFVDATYMDCPSIGL